LPTSENIAHFLKKYLRAIDGKIGIKQNLQRLLT